MKIRSAKNKGQRHQKEIVMKLRERFDVDHGEDNCFDGDIQARLMGGAGRDIILSPAVQKVFPFSIEAKNVERLNIWDAIRQAEQNSGKLRPMVIFKRNRSKTYVCLELQDLLDVMPV